MLGWASAGSSGRIVLKGPRIRPIRFFSVAATTTRSGRKNKLSVEEEFQRLSPLEHILKCPNMYIGATSLTEKSKPRYMVTSLTANRVKFEKIDQPYIPGIVKLFDEVLVNACDNAVRDPVGTKNIDITYNSKDGSFSVRNNGKGIPVKLHPKEKLYVPELVLGHLLTGSNFEKAEANSTGGRHGYGAKLCNVFSTRFSVETLDDEMRLKFIRRWKNNMTPDGNPEIVPVENAEPYTLVSFAPDWARFGLKHIDAGSLAMIKTRVVETAGLLGPHVSVTWNENLVPIHSFEELCKTCFHETPTRKLVFSKPTTTLRVGLGLSEDGFSDLSFVNSMSTHRGGSHVEAVVSQVSGKVFAAVKKAEFTERDLRKHLAVFVDFKTNHPEFDSQSKDKLTSNVADDPTIQLPEAFIKRFIKESGIVEALQASASAKVEKVVNKRIATHTIPKLEDALRAGTSDSSQCTLIVTEGDSAKALAMEGLSVVGRNTYGVYPLRGKVLNVRDKSMQEVAENKEILNIMNAMGLKVNAKTTDGLRYGRVMFMTDQDHDGSHIKGLLLNLFDSFWPELAQKHGFLTQFVTPLLKAKPRNQSKAVVDFFSQSEFEKWTKENPNYASEYKIKYYKGLGTSTAQEAREYFSNLPRHIVDFSFTRGDLDRELLDKVFRMNRSHERKDWLRMYRANDESFKLLDVTPSATTTTNPESAPLPVKGKWKRQVNPPMISPSAQLQQRVQTVETFINTEFAAFSWYDNERSIPSVFDGLKPSQRKVFFALLEKSRSNFDEIKVAQLAGYVAEVTSYHHGEKSLVDTIVNMAQDFVGANNIPLLRSEGQFGTRSQGGKDAAAGRYIFTGLSPIARLLFPVEDDRLLERKMEDGFPVEPKWYLPIVPLVLINGCEGIGTGWNSFIPAHHPSDVCDAVRKLIDLHEREFPSPESRIQSEHALEVISPLLPWYKGYIGRIVPSVDRFECFGLVEHIPSAGSAGTGGSSRKTQQGVDSILVRELPLGMWTEDFKERIVQHIKDQKLWEYRDESEDPSRIQFRLFGDDLPQYMMTECNKWRTFLDMKNMNLFDAANSIRHFADAREIIAEFFHARLELYVKRRANSINQLTSEHQGLIRERDLIRKVVQMEDDAESNHSKVQLLGKSGSSVIAHLENLGFNRSEIDRMMRKPIGEFTLERVTHLEESIAQKKLLLDEMMSSSPYSLWRADLDRLQQALQKDSKFDRSVVVSLDTPSNLRSKPKGSKNVSSTLETLPSSSRKRAVAASPTTSTTKKKTAVKKTAVKTKK